MASNFNDNIQGSSASETLLGLNGDDVIHGGGGADTLIGGQNQDKLFGNDDGKTGDFLEGDAGDDQITPGDNDTVSGGAGIDFIFTSGNHNFLLDGGADGDDYQILGTGNNTGTISDSSTTSDDHYRVIATSNTVLTLIDHGSNGADSLKGDVLFIVGNGNGPGGSLAPEDVLFTRRKNDLLITAPNTPGFLIDVVGYYTTAGFIENITTDVFKEAAMGVPSLQPGQSGTGFALQSGLASVARARGTTSRLNSDAQQLVQAMGNFSTASSGLPTAAASSLQSLPPLAVAG